MLHDWPDAERVAILRAIPRAAAPGASVLVIGNVLAEDEADPRVTRSTSSCWPSPGERTDREPAEPAVRSRAGFGDATVVGTAGPLRIVDATAR